MCHDEQAALVLRSDALEDLEYDVAVAAVQIAGGLVAHDDERVVDERTCDGDPLLLPTRQFHPALVEQFIQCIGVFPVGSVVELNSGEIAIVIAQNMVRRMQPRVMVVKDMNGNPLKPYKMLDLMKEPKVRPDETYRIQRSLEYGSVETMMLFRSSRVKFAVDMESTPLSGKPACPQP